MCAPRVTRRTSIRYSNSCHTRVNMGASIFFTAAMIRAFRPCAMCRVTRGAHIEHLYLSKKLYQFSCRCEQFH
jgi:hypothetical protein